MDYALNRNFDLVALHLHGVGRDFNLAVGGEFAGANIVFPHVPGAGHDVAFERALAQRPAAMVARVIDGVNRPTDVEERDGFAVYIYGLP